MGQVTPWRYSSTGNRERRTTFANRGGGGEGGREGPLHADSAFPLIRGPPFSCPSIPAEAFDLFFVEAALTRAQRDLDVHLPHLVAFFRFRGEAVLARAVISRSCRHLVFTRVGATTERS